MSKSEVILKLNFEAYLALSFPAENKACRCRHFRTNYSPACNQSPGIKQQFTAANMHGSDNSQPIFSRMLHRSHLNKGHLTMLLFEKISFDM